MNGKAAGGRIITLTTDFGVRDPFAAMMKGEILKINPEATLIDISHGIEPGDTMQAALVMDMAARHFAPGTIHVCVVDPGVGSQRRPILVITDDHYFIGPDNGVFTLICQREYLLFKVIQLNQDHFFSSTISPVFHGRDIFAPVAAWLSKGIDSSRFGEEITEFSKLAVPKTSRAGEGMLVGAVIYSDRFGNAATNITAEEIDELTASRPEGRARVTIKDKVIDGLSTHFAERGAGEAGALINSTGRLEIFINRGNAQRTLGLRPGERVEVSWG